MSFRARVVWNRDPADLGRAVNEYGQKLVYSALVDYLNKNAAEILERMKREAPWTDRTGEARRQLISQVVVDGAQVSLYLAHGVEYGKYLELRWGGRYAIIGPTIARVGTEVMAGIRTKMGGGGKSGDWKSW